MTGGPKADHGWRSLGDRAGGSRNLDKIGITSLACRGLDTTWVYQWQLPSNRQLLCKDHEHTHVSTCRLSTVLPNTQPNSRLIDVAFSAEANTFTLYLPGPGFSACKRWAATPKLNLSSTLPF